MTRTVLSIATSLFTAAMLFAPAAQACISCEYVPEVLHAGSKSHAAKRVEKKRVVAVSKDVSARPAKKRIAKAEPVARKAPKKINEAKAAPTPVTAEPQDTTSTSVADTAQPTGSETMAAETTATTSTTPADSQVAHLGCTKFIPAVGVTVAVACE